MKEYLVGIDFGHGETAAWIVPINGCKVIGEKGNALRLTSTNDEDKRQLMSCIFRGRNDEYSLQLSSASASSPITELKSKPRKLSEQKKKAYRAFIRLVVERLLEVNDILRFNKENNDSNFDICIACPTSWKQNEIKEYLDFFNEALKPIGIQVLWIIKESDAAFYSKSNMAANDGGCTLVIDYGSSTIDYTAMVNLQKISDDEWSSATLGASNIEKVMTRPVNEEDLADFDNTYTRALKIIEETGNRHMDVDDILKFECRKAKEYLFTEKQREANVHFSMHTYMGGGPRCIFNYYFDLTSNTKFAAYCQDVKDNLENVKNNLNRRVDRVILSGGACIMPWFKLMVKSVFKDAKILDDQHPQYVVAEGVALYAKAQWEAFEELKKKLETVDFVKIYKEADRGAMLDAVESMLSSSLRKLKDMNSVTAHTVRDVFCNAMKDMDSNNMEYVEIFQKKYDAALSDAVSKRIREAIHDVFKVWIDTSDINLHVKADEMYWSLGLFDVGGRYYNKISDWIVKNSNAAFGNTFFDWDKQRVGSEKEHIIDNTLEAVKSFLKETDLWDEDALSKSAASVRKVTFDEAEKAFYDKQIFKTTFSI